ncbi:SgcJ/EcaC family oxidoreductase [Streptantibioticus ferralitis]|uniref:SgcJ/EcaC family oxidoreductase n=1 Tax=Streptantibioticus ferralitis TaxID=236510 RepID=A0ABT5YYX4_9ACTN|nr:SgcJ/EcaC family oxidoreductase [Streptantibioticus ferralitis]MDF2256745.1 SgcJ/EcaC family oxidoreductase [Streptantibioticus ferralitis]
MRRKYYAGLAVATTAVLFTSTGSTHAIGTRSQPLAGNPAVAAATHYPTERQIAALFDQWNAALATGNAYRVANLYAPNAVLLPTVSARIRTNRAEIVDYFKHFLENKPVGTIQKRYINILGRNAAIDTGLYQFRLTGKDGETTKVNARYTYVYQLRGGKWLIVNHHSSELPTGD